MIGDVQNKDELVQIVDENDVEVRGARRQEMRASKLIHRRAISCGVYVLDVLVPIEDMLGSL